MLTCFQDPANYHHLVPLRTGNQSFPIAISLQPSPDHGELADGFLSVAIVKSGQALLPKGGRIGGMASSSKRKEKQYYRCEEPESLGACDHIARLASP